MAVARRYWEAAGVAHKVRSLAENNYLKTYVIMTTAVQYLQWLQLGANVQ